MGFHVLVSPRLRCHPSYGVLTITPARLSPAERVSLGWTHKTSYPPPANLQSLESKLSGVIEQAGSGGAGKT